MSKRTRNDQLDAALTGIDKLTTMVDSLTHTVENQSAKLDFQSAKLESQSAKLDAQSTEISELKHIVNAQSAEILDLKSTVKALEAENMVLKQRLTKIEDRLAVLDHQMANLAPMVRSLLEDEHNILLDQDYQLIRDSESAKVFVSSRDIIVENNLDTSGYPTGLKGASLEIGKSLTKFYRLVLGYSPRQIKSRSMYWPDVENPVINPHIRLSKSLNLA